LFTDEAAETFVITHVFSELSSKRLRKSTKRQGLRKRHEIGEQVMEKLCALSYYLGSTVTHVICMNEILPDNIFGRWFS